ncbi:hypothetical protein VSVS12_04586 (plasmid) [Vibrio scophthalmi]|nr:hypothetical protein [Vibrio scophthalmi]ANS88284.1 hypothetical protein VSVS12_04586 [Vibrio scophthalmi]
MIKKGRSITGIKFLFRWLKLGTFDELNRHDALKSIRELELKRLQNNIRLNNSELETLAIAYRYIGRDDQAIKVEESLAKRHFQQTEKTKKTNRTILIHCSRRLTP